jgi:hypothetical protein
MRPTRMIRVNPKNRKTSTATIQVIADLQMPMMMNDFATINQYYLPTSSSIPSVIRPFAVFIVFYLYRIMSKEQLKQLAEKWIAWDDVIMKIIFFSLKLINSLIILFIIYIYYL